MYPFVVSCRAVRDARLHVFEWGSEIGLLPGRMAMARYRNGDRRLRARSRLAVLAGLSGSISRRNAVRDLLERRSVPARRGGRDRRMYLTRTACLLSIASPPRAPPSPTTGTSICDDVLRLRLGLYGSLSRVSSGSVARLWALMLLWSKPWLEASARPVRRDMADLAGCAGAVSKGAGAEADARSVVVPIGVRTPAFTAVRRSVSPAGQGVADEVRRKGLEAAGRREGRDGPRLHADLLLAALRGAFGQPLQGQREERGAPPEPRRGDRRAARQPKRARRDRRLGHPRI